MNFHLKKAQDKVNIIWHAYLCIKQPYEAKRHIWYMLELEILQSVTYSGDGIDSKNQIEVREKPLKCCLVLFFFNLQCML